MDEADSGNMSAGEAAGITIGVTVAAGLLIVAGVWCRRRSMPGSSGSTQALNVQSPTYQAIAGEVDEGV